jgi:hypothetical protein
VSLPFNASTMRYAIDFVPLLVLGAALLAALAWLGMSRRARTVFASAWVLAVAAGSVAGILLVQTPCPGTGSC